MINGGGGKLTHPFLSLGAERIAQPVGGFEGGFDSYSDCQLIDVDSYSD